MLSLRMSFVNFHCLPSLEALKLFYDVERRNRSDREMDDQFNDGPELANPEGKGTGDNR